MTTATVTPDTQKAPSQLAVFLAAIRLQESGSLAGNYSDVNKKSGAKGAYQFEPGTDMYKAAEAAGWTPAAQDKIAAQTVTEYYRNPAIGNGSWELVARAWYGGPGAVNHPEWGGGPGYPNVGQYGKQVAATFAELMKDPSVLTGDIGQAAGGGVFFAGPGNVGGNSGDPIFGTTSGPLAAAWGAITDLPSAVEALAKIASTAASWLGNRKNWLRILEVVGGAVGIVVAFFLISGRSQQVLENGAALAAV